MKKKIFLFLLILCFSFCPYFAFGGENVFADSTKVYLGGQPAGFKIQTRGAFVAGLSDVITENGIVSPSKQAGIERGDVIMYIDGVEINCSSDISRVLSLTKDSVTIEYQKCNDTYSVEITPAVDLNGEKKLGLFIRDDVSGIGTITFIDGNRVATLGHPVLGENDEILKVLSGKIYSCNITGFIKGERGNPGELRGVILKSEEIAEINENTDSGVFGTINPSYNVESFSEIENGDAKIGDAEIYTTVKGGTPKKYSVSIVKIDDLFSDTKNYVIKITDKELLESTGGIVQGMSGSPIVQNGKLVGAITHVFINDPTRGFGISIKNMLNK